MALTFLEPHFTHAFAILSLSPPILEVDLQESELQWDFLPTLLAV
jgi:hypothetical protein